MTTMPARRDPDRIKRDLADLRARDTTARQKIEIAVAATAALRADITARRAKIDALLDELLEAAR